MIEKKPKNGAGGERQNAWHRVNAKLTELKRKAHEGHESVYSSTNYHFSS